MLKFKVGDKVVVSSPEYAKVFDESIRDNVTSAIMAHGVGEVVYISHHIGFKVKWAEDFYHLHSGYELELWHGKLD